jgi:hypothetical protein
MTGDGPVECLIKHINDPFGENLLTNFAKVGGAF